MRTTREALERAMAVNPVHREAVDAGTEIRERISGYGNAIFDSLGKRVDSMTIASRYSRTRLVDTGLPLSPSSEIQESGGFTLKFIGVTEDQAKKEILRLRIQAGRDLVSQLAGYVEALELEIRAAGQD